MTPTNEASRLSLFEAARVVATRDFKAILMSRAFLFFLLGPLFPVVVSAMAGSIGGTVKRDIAATTVAVVMSEADNAAIVAAAKSARGSIDGVPQVRAVSKGDAGADGFAPEALLKDPAVAVVLTGDLANPVLVGAQRQIDRWDGPVTLLAAMAAGETPSSFPAIAQKPLQNTAAAARSGRVSTAQAGQLVLFLLMMLLAGMVLSNLVEEKANKIIEVLAASVPMDAVFVGKLFATLAVSFVGITLWALVGAGIVALAGDALPSLPEPAVGWPLFWILGVVYFSMGYLLLGSIFLTIGGMASTVREVQTLSMPITMAQVMVFFLAAVTTTDVGSRLELTAAIFPLSSPFTMISRAAQFDELWVHGVAIAWQAICVAIFIKAGATLFRRKVMKSGKQGGGLLGLFRRKKAA